MSQSLEYRLLLLALWCLEKVRDSRDACVNANKLSTTYLTSAIQSVHGALRGYNRR